MTTDHAHHVNEGDLIGVVKNGDQVVILAVCGDDEDETIQLILHPRAAELLFDALYEVMDTEPESRRDSTALE